MVACLALAGMTPAAAAPAPDNVAVQVVGSPLTNITVSPATLTPAFAPSTHDYDVVCQPAVNDLTFTFTGAGPITIGTTTASSVSVAEGLVENAALVVTAPDPASPATTTRYWIRCLPHDFPRLTVTQAFTAPAAPGYYLTGTATGSTRYAMVLDQNAVPVWYQKTPNGAVDVEALANEPDTIAWTDSAQIGISPTASFGLHHLDTETTDEAQAPLGPTDPHEFLEDAAGNRWFIGTPIIPYDLTDSPWNSVNQIFDCVIQEVDPKGHSIYTWIASQHVDLDEATGASPQLASIVPGSKAADIFHCNSLDLDSAGDLLVSMRNTDAVYMIPAPAGNAGGTISWKLGGTTSALHDSEKALAITNDPQTTPTASTISGQHDARFQSNGDITLYDDHTGQNTQKSRGIEFAIDPTAATATLVWQALGSQPAAATGSFRRYADVNGTSGNDNLIDWGFVSTPGFTEFDGAQPPKTLFAVTFPAGVFQYRAVKVPTSALDINVLRATAGAGLEPHGGILAGATSTSSWGSGRLDSFMTGADHAVWHHWLDGNGWHWESLGGKSNSATSAVSWASGRIDLFARGTDGALWHDFCTASCSGNAWHGWESLGGVLADEPSAVSGGSQSLDVFVQGTDNHLWRDSYGPTGWHWTGLGGQLATAPAAVASPGEVDAFVEGTDRAMWQWSSTGSGWAPSREGVLAGKPAAVSSGTGRLDAVVEGVDLALWHWSSTNGWERAGGRLGTAPAAVSRGAPGIDVVLVGTDQMLWHARYDGTAWTWESLGGQLSGPVSAASWGPSRVDIMGTGSDASLQHVTAG